VDDPSPKPVQNPSEAKPMTANCYTKENNCAGYDANQPLDSSVEDEDSSLAGIGIPVAQTTQLYVKQLQRGQPGKAYRSNSWQGTHARSLRDRREVGVCESACGGVREQPHWVVRRTLPSGYSCSPSHSSTSSIGREECEADW
jgi:hypothetical protein